MGRSGKLTEVANTVAFLLSDRASYVDGVTLTSPAARPVAKGLQPP